MDELLAALKLVCDRRDLSAETTESVVSAIMRGECQDIAIAAWLAALRVKGETTEEVVGAARAMRGHATRIPTQRTGLLDTCGTGGDQLHTFNISTATAIVLAATGVPIAKHGNRGVSSTSGSADVLEALGLNLQLTPAQVGQCLDEIGLGFCFAPLLHGAMKYVAPIRRALKIRSIFNLLGPLTNPAGAEYQLLGAANNETAAKLADALAQLGTQQALVVCGAGQLDEISLWGETAVFVVRDGTVNRQTWTPAQLGLAECQPGELRVEGPAESADVIRGILAGKPGPAREIVLANAAGGLVAATRVTDPREGVQQAAQAIDSGAAANLLSQLVSYTQSCQPASN